MKGFSSGFWMCLYLSIFRLLNCLFIKFVHNFLSYSANRKANTDCHITSLVQVMSNQSNSTEYFIFEYISAICNFTSINVPGVMIRKYSIQIGIISVEDRVKNQPMAQPHHGYSYVLLNLSGVYLTKENRNVHQKKTEDY